MISLEGHLNQAAAGDGMDYNRFQRTIIISWTGNEGVTAFWPAERNAHNSARRLIPLLVQLHEAGVATNIIAHSLGARVTLAALNLLAQMALNVTRDQIVLWEPALTQRALAADPNLDEPHKDPLGHEHFARAHETVNRIVVLHTPYDGVLGPRPTDADKDENRLDEWLVEDLHGVYAWRYLVSGELDNILPTKQVEDPHEPTVPGHTPRYTGASQDRELAREKLRTQLHEAAEQANDLSDLQRQGRMPLPQLDRLAPWGHWLTFSDADINTIAERLEALYDAYQQFRVAARTGRQPRRRARHHGRALHRDAPQPRARHGASV
jgi:hypothetical protein